MNTARLPRNKTKIIAYLAVNPACLQHFSARIKNDRDCVLSAVSHDGLTLKHASPELKKDRHVVLTAVTQNAVSLCYASSEAQDDPKIVMQAVRKSGNMLSAASARLKADRQIVLAAIQSNVDPGWAYKSASQELRADLEILSLSIKTAHPFMHLTSMDDQLKSHIRGYIPDSLTQELLDSLKLADKVSLWNLRPLAILTEVNKLAAARLHAQFKQDSSAPKVSLAKPRLWNRNRL